MTDARHLLPWAAPDVVTVEPLPPDSWRWRHFGWQVVPAHVQRSRASTAVHEAGHALVAVWLGLPVTGAELLDEPDRSGIVHLEQVESGLPQAERDELAREAGRSHPALYLWFGAMYAAGFQAELILHSVALHGTVLRASTDEDTVIEILRMLDLPAYSLGYVQRLARARLTSHWSTVIEIAQVLLERGEVPAGEIRAIVDRGPALPPLPDGHRIEPTGLEAAAAGAER